MLVSTNLSSLSAQRMLFENNKAASTAMERLATGFRINKAQDDVAGSAIADRMTSQVRGLNMAVKNVNDAMAMLSVAQGASQKVLDLLHRARELSIASRNDTLSASDTTYIGHEITQIRLAKTQSSTKPNSLTAHSPEGSTLARLLIRPLLTSLAG